MRGTIALKVWESSSASSSIIEVFFNIIQSPKKLQKTQLGCSGFCDVPLKKQNKWNKSFIDVNYAPVWIYVTEINKSNWCFFVKILSFF